MIHLGVITGMFVCALAGWAAAGQLGAATGALIGLGVVMPWWGQPPWVWARSFLLLKSPKCKSVAPVTATNDRATGGVRYQDGVAATAIRVLGKAYQSTIAAGATAVDTGDAFDVVELLAVMRQSLGVTVESLSVVSIGSRRRVGGDYPAVYDSLIGTIPYAGRRETWLIVRISAVENAESLRWRASVGAAALAATQRIAAELRRNGIRASVADSAGIVGLDGRLGLPLMDQKNRPWRCIRSHGEWLTTYCYGPEDLKKAVLEDIWALPVDGAARCVTVFPDGTATATVTLRTAHPPKGSPSVRLRQLPGRQDAALTAAACGPRPRLRGVRPGPLPPTLTLPIGPSGVLIGRLPFGERLMMPFGDAAGLSRVHVATGDAIAKRIVLRLAAAGERVSLHSNDFGRWQSVRIPGVTVTDQPRPDPDATVCVIDGTVSLAAQPGTIVFVGPPGQPVAGADVAIVETGPGSVLVRVAGQEGRTVEFEQVRGENRYVTAGRVAPEALAR